VAQEITCIELINSVALVALGELSIAGAISREQSEASESGNQQRDFPNNVIIICLIFRSQLGYGHANHFTSSAIGSDLP